MNLYVPQWLVISFTSAVILTIVVTVGVLLVFPWFRLEYRRRRSRKIRPKPEQIWMQDEDILYIDAVDQFGVELIHWGPGAKGINRWKDSWPEWELRLKTRVVWFTGATSPLGNA